MNKLVRSVQIVVAVITLCAISTSFAYYSTSEKSKSFGHLYPHYPKIDYGNGDNAELIKRGEYLARAGDCIACHTHAQKGGKPFAGGLPLATPFGTFYSPNITPDKKTGIGKWRFKDFKRAMHDGKAPDGSNYFPVFPYAYFNRISDQDLRALWAYFKAIPAVEAKNKGNDLPFPLNSRFLQYGWKILFYYPYDGQYKYDPKQSAVWNRGKYLVDGLGHCSMCHTPLNIFGAPRRKHYLTGSFIEGFWAPNITQYGLSTVTTAQVVDVFKKDQLLGGSDPVAGPMAEVNHNSLGRLKTSDLHAIATYLKTVKSDSLAHIKGSTQAPNILRGQIVFRRVCSTCHLKGETGAPRIADSENWFLRAKQGKSLLYRHALNGYNSMPIKGACVTCSDADIESAVDFMLYESLTRAQQRALEKIKQPKPSAEDGQQIYTLYCSTCHDKGRLRAPVLGDKVTWAPILRQNMDVLITKTLKGSRKMPPKGGCTHCSTAEVISAVKYMVDQSKTKGDYSLW